MFCHFGRMSFATSETIPHVKTSRIHRIYSPHDDLHCKTSLILANCRAGASWCRRSTGGTFQRAPRHRQSQGLEPVRTALRTKPSVDPHVPHGCDTLSARHFKMLSFTHHCPFLAPPCPPGSGKKHRTTRRKICNVGPHTPMTHGPWLSLPPGTFPSSKGPAALAHVQLVPSATHMFSKPAPWIWW